MADQFVQIPQDSNGKKVDTSEVTVGANVVERQRMVLADPTQPTALAQVDGLGNLAVADAPGRLLAEQTLLLAQAAYLQSIDPGRGYEVR